MTQSNLTTKLSMCFLVAVALGASACVAETPDEIGAEEGEVGVAKQATSSYSCTVYQRGVSGTVADATLWQNAPGYNDGSYTSLNAGTSSGGFKQVLLHFDISNIPTGAEVDFADISVYKSWKEKGSTIGVHEVLAPWGESAVTYANFAGSFSQTPSDSFWAWGGGGGDVQFSVTEIVQNWVDGVSPNNGLLLQDMTNNTLFHSSEHAIVSSHPKLKVCYTLTP